MARAEAKQPFWLQALNHQRSWRGWKGAFRFLMSLAQGGAEIYPDRKFQGASQFAYETIKVIKEAFERIERGAYFDFKLLNRRLAAFHPEIDAVDPRDLKRRWRARDGVWRPRRFRFNLVPSAAELSDTEFLLMTLLGIILDEFMDYVRERYSDAKYPGWTRGRPRVVIVKEREGERLVLVRAEKTETVNPRVASSAASPGDDTRKRTAPVAVSVRRSLPRAPHSTSSGEPPIHSGASAGTSQRATKTRSANKKARRTSATKQTAKPKSKAARKPPAKPTTGKKPTKKPTRKPVKKKAAKKKTSPKKKRAGTAASEKKKHAAKKHAAKKTARTKTHK